MQTKQKFTKQSLATIILSFFLLLSVFSISTATLVSADEVNSNDDFANLDDIVKNDKWIEMENELAVMEINQSRSRSLSPTSTEDRAAYILEKYDGAVATSRSAGVSQRIQNGGWNVYYNTKGGKQVARTAYNGMYVAWGANGGAAAAAAAWSKATGIGWIAGVVFAGIGGANAFYATLSKTCRDKIDSNGNTGTARMTLTEARWSAKYDNRW